MAHHTMAHGTITRMTNLMICGSTLSTSTAMLTDNKTAGSIADIHFWGREETSIHLRARITRGGRDKIPRQDFYGP
jgi:hypothetical protein